MKPYALSMIVFIVRKYIKLSLIWQRIVGEMDFYPNKIKMASRTNEFSVNLIIVSCPLISRKGYPLPLSLYKSSSQTK
jgi:hypothetical protein